jgi:hypothetical protein
VNDQVPGLAAGARLADVIQLEERRRGIRRWPRSPASSPTHRSAGIRPAAASAARCERAGLERRGAPVPHALATEMLRAGASRPEVGQVRHRSQLSTSVYANSRELHQPGEKPQVSRSRDSWNDVPLVLMPAL